MSRSFTYEEKLSAIGLVLQGKSVRSVSNELHLGNHLLYEWVEIYHLFGPEGLKNTLRKKKHLPFKEKCKIVCEYLENDLTLCQISAKYNISSATLGAWICTVENMAMKL